MILETLPGGRASQRSVDAAWARGIRQEAWGLYNEGYGFWVGATELGCDAGLRSLGRGCLKGRSGFAMSDYGVGLGFLQCPFVYVVRSTLIYVVRSTVNCS